MRPRRPRRPLPARPHLGRGSSASSRSTSRTPTRSCSASRSGLAFLFLAAAAIIAGKRIVDQRKAIEERARIGERRRRRDGDRAIDDVAMDTTGEPPPPDERLTRRTLVVGAAGAVGPRSAPRSPSRSLSSAQKVGDDIVDTPWQRGRRASSTNSETLSRSTTSRVGTFLPAFPRGRRQARPRLAARRRAGDPEELELPEERAAGRPRECSPSRRSARTPAARSRSSATRSTSRPRRSAGARLPVPLLDVRRHDRRRSHLRPRRPLAAPASACARRRPLLVANGEFSEPPGPSYLGTRRAKRDQAGRPLPRASSRGSRRFVTQGCCATSSPTTGRSCSARSRSTRSSSSSAPASSSTFFFDPSTGDRRSTTARTRRCRARMSRRPTDSAVDLSLDVTGGLLIRQTHHWAALTSSWSRSSLHLMRVFFTGAFRKPRELTYYIGVTLLSSSCSRASPATRCPTTCCPGWASRSATAS